MKKRSTILLFLCGAMLIASCAYHSTDEKTYKAEHPNYADSAAISYAIQHEIMPDSAVKVLRTMNR